MKTLKLLSILFLFVPQTFAKYPEEEKNAKGLNAGFWPTKYGRKKDRDDGFFKQFDFVWKQNDNLYIVKKKINLKNGDETQIAWLVDKNGKYLTKKTYTDIGDFSEGMAEVTFGPHDFCHSCYYTGRYEFVVHLSNTHGFINEKGEEIISPRYKIVKGSFTNGVCLVGVWDDQLYFVDKTGKQQFNKVFKKGEQFKGGIAGVTFRNGVKNFIDKNGAALIPKKFLYIQPYNEEYRGMIRAYKTLDKKVGFWTANCESLIAPQYDSFNYSMLAGNIMVEKNGKFGFVDMFTGKETIPNLYSQFRSDKNRNYVLLKNNLEWYRVDTLNKAQKIGKGNDILSLGFGLYKLKRTEKWGVVDSLGIVKSNFSFDEITKLHTEEYFLAIKDNNYGLINTNGQVITEPKYDKVGFLKNGNIYGQKELYQFTLNTKGKILAKEFKPEIVKNVFFGLLVSLMIGLTIFVVKIK
ncbi:WG repeat-containing protein [Lacihabitans soyangensis]|uniref:WG repeat-containing protein n=1 Tax=Lacihabitans soyangensis TaxID=869394 RepID=A0AAE3H8R0_9BACT|nr:WG repeat-containing protein [Lacihabitans soyangensis]MCP9765375.1 WG repeat-containing protein [Lacihabitans soyangensis]